MSITTGIEIRKKDPLDESYDHNAWSSWKNQYFDMWVSAWLNHHIGHANLPAYDCHGEHHSVIVPKEALLQMGDDLVNRRFGTAPEWAEDIEDLGEYTMHYGKAFKELAEKAKEDEVLVYYWMF